MAAEKVSRAGKLRSSRNDVVGWCRSVHREGYSRAKEAIAARKALFGYGENFYQSPKRCVSKELKF